MQFLYGFILVARFCDKIVYYKCTSATPAPREKKNAERALPDEEKKYRQSLNQITQRISKNAVVQALHDIHYGSQIF